MCSLSICRLVNTLYRCHHLLTYSKYLILKILLYIIRGRNTVILGYQNVFWVCRNFCSRFIDKLVLSRAPQGLKLRRTLQQQCGPFRYGFLAAYLWLFIHLCIYIFSFIFKMLSLHLNMEIMPISELAIWTLVTEVTVVCRLLRRQENRQYEHDVVFLFLISCSCIWLTW